MATCAENFNGRYAMDRANSGDLGRAALTLAGVGFVKRTMLLALGIDMVFAVDGQKLVEDTLTTFVNKHLEFTLDGTTETEYYDDAFGYTMVKTIKYEDGKLVAHVKEKKSGKFSLEEVRYLSEDKKHLHFDSVMTLAENGKTAETKRLFVRKQ